MENIITGLQYVLDALGTGISTLSQIGAGTESYGVAAQKKAAGTGSFIGAFKTVFNYFAGLFGFAAVE